MLCQQGFRLGRGLAAAPGLDEQGFAQIPGGNARRVKGLDEFQPFFHVFRSEMISRAQGSQVALEKALIVEGADDQTCRHQLRPGQGLDAELGHEPGFQGITAAAEIVDGLIALIAGRPDIVIADIQQGIVRHLFLQKIGQILGVESQHLDGQALDLQYFRFLFEFQR